MQHSALGGEAVLLPQPLDMDQRSLPQAVNGVLKHGEGGIGRGPSIAALP